MKLELLHTVTHELIIKKSRFIAFVYPVQDKTQIKALLEELHTTYPDARHICSCFILANDSSIDDDGEPKGTAGKPMFNVLMHKNLINVLAVVVRYFGGIKLGAGGLTRAYTQAVSHALMDAEYIKIIPKKQIHVELPFELESSMRHFCEQLNIEIQHCHYQHMVSMSLTMDLHEYNKILIQLKNKLQGQLKILPQESLPTDEY